MYGVYEAAPSPRKGSELGVVSEIKEAWLAIEDGQIADFGSMDQFPGIADWKGLR